MIALPPFFLANWRLLAVVALLVAAGAAVGLSRYQLAGCRASVAEYRRAYDLLSQATQRQTDSIRAAEQMAMEAAKRGAKARSEAAGAIDVAQRSADALGRVMAAPRGASECPQAEAVQAVREDLRR